MDLGPMGRGGARRRTRRRMTAMQSAASNTAPKQSQQPVGPTALSSEPTSMLEMLKVLHSAGILNDDEYAAKKMQVVDLL